MAPAFSRSRTRARDGEVMPSRHSTAIVAAPRLSREEILSSRASVPAHVVHRNFVQETVILNLATGTYHGLNPTGGKMLETLGVAATVGEAAATLAAYYRQPQASLEEDLYKFCLDLHERGLVELAHD